MTPKPVRAAGRLEKENQSLKERILEIELENATLREALKNHAEEAAKALNAEPVAWMWNGNTGVVFTEQKPHSQPAVPLYTSPASPKPNQE